MAPFGCCCALYFYKTIYSIKEHTVSKISIKPDSTKYVTVGYMGHKLTIPAHHNWIAITKVPSATGTDCYLASFAEEPKLVRKGYYVAQEGTDFTYQTRIADTNAEGSLVQVQNQTAKASKSPEQVLLDAAKKFVADIQEAIENADDLEEAVHDIYCPEHGLLPALVQDNMDSISAVFGSDSDEEESSGSAIKGAIIAKVLQDILSHAADEKAHNSMLEDLAGQLGAKVIKFS